DPWPPARPDPLPRARRPRPARPPRGDGAGRDPAPRAPQAAALGAVGDRRGRCPVPRSRAGDRGGRRTRRGGDGEPGRDGAADGALAPTPPSTAHAAAGMPAIVTRAQWGADESLRDPTLQYTSTVRVAFVHHTASVNNYWERSGWTEADAARDIRAIYAYSVLSGGYADVPYNFFVDYGGRVYEGRAGGVDKAVHSAATG